MQVLRNGWNGSDMKLNVVYLTWGETPRSYGLYRSQVAETVRDLALEDPELDLTLIAGVPLIHSGLLRDRWRYGREIATLRQVLGRAGFARALIPVPQNFVFPTRRSFNVIFTGARFSLLPKLQRLNPDIVHCRSLLAAWIAQQLRADHGLNYRVLYDPRSIWPEMQYRRRPDDDDLRAFKEIETRLVKAVDAVVSVNGPMADHYRQMGARHSWVNYLAASLPETETAMPPAAPLKLFYAGSLKEGGIQDPRLLFRLFARARDLREAALTVVTTSPVEALQQLAAEVLDEAGRAAITFTSARSPKEVIDLAGGHHLACNAYQAPKTENDRILCATGFSTKSAEYLAAGLPILVSPYPQAIGDLVTQHHVGHVFDDKQPDMGIDAQVLDRLLEPGIRQTCRQVAAQHFDRGQVVSRFVGFYRAMMEA